jgi:WD40 repeat protein/mono/diheme cytochrome c family protein
MGAIALPSGRAADPAESETAQSARPAAVSYYRDVRPIFQANCQGCHQPAKAGGSLELTAFKSLLTTGDSGSPAVVPGKPEESYLIEQITPTDGEAAMPQGKKPLSEHEIALIRRWIEQGAHDDTPADATPVIDADHPPVYSGPPVITSLDWSPDGVLLAVAGYHEVLLFKADGSGRVGRLIGMSPRIESVRFSPDGTKLAVTGGRPAQMGEVQIWDVAERKLLVSVPVTYDSVFGAAWSPDGKRVAFGGTDKSVRVIDAETGEQVLFQTAHDDWVLGTAFSVDGGHLVSVGRDMTAKLIEVPTQRFVDNITSITPGALKGGIQSVVRHPLRDEIVFGGSDGIPKIYRMHRITARQIGDDANLLWELPSLPGRIFGVDITSDGRTIAAGSSLDGHGYVHVYRVEATPAIPDAIQIILNKPTHTRSQEERTQLQKHYEQGVLAAAKTDIAEAGVYAVALSPDGTRVAAAGGDGTVRLFDSQAGSLVTSFMPVDVQVAASVTANAAASVEDTGLGEDPRVGDTRPREEPPLPVGDAVARLVVEPESIQLDGPARYTQLIVTAELASGAKFDVTRRATLAVSEPVASVDATGLVTPSKNGHALITATLGDKSASARVAVGGLDAPAPPDFIRDVAPILARVGCNQGTCHGAQAGKNGFKLSLRGYDPLFDVRALADDLASRRVNIASPAQSLMLLKPTAAVPHQGGQVLTPGTPYYELLHEWVTSGAQLNLTTPRVTRLEIMPANPVVESIGALQQIRVVAVYADGARRDVTREAFVESGNTDVVKTVAAKSGLLEALRRGEAAALVRYEGNYAATTLTVMGNRDGFAWEEMPANNRIDELVAAKLQRTKTQASPLTNDYEFVRRVYLDLTGLPPTPEQVQAFVGDTRDTRTKRDELISVLVGNDDYVEYWTNKWADLLMVNRKFLGLEGATSMRNWIRGELAGNTPYDEFVRKILTATGSTKDNPAASYFKALRTPQALMENTTHLFLATRFNCNKCHDHPFERWTQDQYYHLAAYFAQVSLSKDPASGDAMVGGTAVESGTPLYEIVADAASGDVKHDRTGAVSPPAFPFDCQHETKDGATRREQLAAWLTSPDNPYFARSYVNRIWGYLMGRGIVEPLDDIRAGNPPTNPDLLDYLTTEFIESGFDTRHVFELICRSRTYQLSVATDRWNEDDQINFSHARARRLPAEVLFDAIYRATGATAVFPGVPPGARAATLPDVGVDLPDGFLGNLGRPARESACECERSSNLQLGPVMALVSGPTVGDAISDPGNAVAKLVQEVADNGELVNRLFLRFLSRPGKPEELNGATQMFEQLNSDHDKLVADLDAYTQEIAPQIAKQEVARQGRIAELQAALEAHREIVKLRRPRDEREQQERIAKAQAALAEYDKQLAAKLPEWEAAQKSVTAWRALDTLEFGASYAARFTEESNGSVFVAGRNAKGSYRVAAPVPLDRVTGIRLEALADKRLPGGGPGRAGSGNFVVTELAARTLALDAPRKLVKSWDFSAATDDWQAEDGAKVVADSGTRFLIGTARRAGIKTSLTAPAGSYLLEIVSGVRSAVTFTVQWTTASQAKFDRARSVRRSLSAGDGSRATAPIQIKADAELTGLRIVVQDNQVVLPIDAVRLFAAEASGYADIKLQKAQATFSQGGYAVETAIDGDFQAGFNNGWAIAPQTGQDQTATFELAAPLENARSNLLEFTLHQNLADGQHSLGRFRISVTGAQPPLGFGLPTDIAAIVVKPADQRGDAERNTLLAYVRKHDEQYKKLEADLANEQKPLPDDPQLKKLEAELAKAQQPLPMDSKLQRLRRAVTLSEQQLKDKRLTVAQDVVWALINSPSFLYNH